ncbi:MAG: hypothetical protein AAFW75_32025 [Cyanobacteria bacterium J06636_16]
MTLLQEAFRENPATFLKDVLFRQQHMDFAVRSNLSEEQFRLLLQIRRLAIAPSLIGRIIVRETASLDCPLVESTLL